MKFLFLFPVLLSQSAQLCQRQQEFSACSTKAATQISTCSAEVSGAVTTSLYGCLCKQNKAMLDCYDLCLDDPQLVLQKKTQLESVNAVCAVTVLTTDAATSTSTSTAKSTAGPTVMTRDAATTSPSVESSKTAPSASETARSPSQSPGIAARRPVSTAGARSQPSEVVLNAGDRGCIFALLILIFAI